MYPNPQDALPLPPHPRLEQFRRRARGLIRACRAGDDALDAWATSWIGGLLEVQPEGSGSLGRDAQRRTRQIADFARDRLTRDDCSLSQAQFVVARAHGFASWAKLVDHIEGIAGADENRSAFERAVEAIVTGDHDALERLLHAHPRLVYARSDREHHATLLHYVSANGVENYRQKTPANIVAITRRLLEEGAEVDAEADVYGGGATTLDLVVTSAHPRIAGVQHELADLLLAHGARVEPRIVRACLMNGCPEAAAHMAAEVPSLTLEEAAGIGRLDILDLHFQPTRSLSNADAAAALMMASWYYRRDVIEYLLDHGVDAATQGTGGETALHIAAYNGHVQLVELLLMRAAPVDVIDDTYRTTPLVWALHAWLVENRTHSAAYRSILLMLADARAHVQSEWIDDDRIRTDPQLYAALSARVGGHSPTQHP